SDPPGPESEVAHGERGPRRRGRPDPADPAEDRGRDRGRRECAEGTAGGTEGDRGAARGRDPAAREVSVSDPPAGPQGSSSRTKRIGTAKFELSNPRSTA